MANHRDCSCDLMMAPARTTLVVENGRFDINNVLVLGNSKNKPDNHMFFFCFFIAMTLLIEVSLPFLCLYEH